MLRNLTSSEIEFVSGGDGEDPPPEDEINVNGTRLQSLSEQLFSHGGLAGFDTQEFVSQLVADGFFVANSDEERENIFPDLYMLVKTQLMLIKHDYSKCIPVGRHSAITHPNRLPSRAVPRLDFTTMGSLTFSRPDRDT